MNGTTNLFSMMTWNSYTLAAKKAITAYNLFDKDHKNVDHVAFRTFDMSLFNLSALSGCLRRMGYVATGTYSFPEKHLRALSFSLEESLLPRVFISELSTDELPERSQAIIEKVISTEKALMISNVPFGGEPWQAWRVLTVKDCKVLEEDSNYALWTAFHSLTPNHLAVSLDAVGVNMDSALDTLVTNGFNVATAGGVMKGSRNVMLQQCSTLSELVRHNVTDGVVEVPAPYCELAYRWLDPVTGKPFDGFIEKSTDKIFESTTIMPTEHG